ncbi:MAG: D-alanyl-D-alanine carboxypeptidase, partial [Epulopiscium sp.]|nr:D-alanyl-D-alanine carboxypeptidase [Candidatus Epulonipiscium sp.]
YTDEAGLCLASLAKVGKKEYILITTGAEGNHFSEQYHITDALAVYNSIGSS